ncbi:MAG: NUDIX hydrolase [Pseudomonadota bacterium]
MTEQVDVSLNDRQAEEAADVGPLSYVAGITRQAGAMAWRERDGIKQIVIITSRRTGRWVFPKGGIDPGMTEAMTAANELYEEAGVIGVPDEHPIGTYRTAKIRPPLIWTVEIALYPVRITDVLDAWLESGQRERRFVTMDEAEHLLAEPEMAALARAFLESQSGLAVG